MFQTRLTIKHLEMVQAIETAGTLTKAAHLLSISQPALTSRLHDAESILGIRLFQRRGRKLTLSAPGQLLLRSARRILEELTDVESGLTNLPGGTGEVFRVGIPQYASLSWLPAAVTAFEQRFPSVELEIVSVAALHPRQALLQGDVDFALVSSPKRRIQVDRSKFRSQGLFRDEFVALLPAKHSNAGKPFLVADDFIDETYITNSTIPERNREYELFFQPNGIYPKRVVQVGFSGAIIDLVVAGIGSTISTRWILESDERYSGIVSKPLTKGGLFLEWHGIYPHAAEFKSQAHALCDVIAESAGK